MDKARVTYRFDENGKVVRDGTVPDPTPVRPKVSGPVGAREFARDFDAWSETDAEEIARLERLIRDHRGPERDPDAGADPDVAPPGEQPLGPRRAASGRRRGVRMRTGRFRPPAFLKTVLSALAAVATGLACGYLVLLWFSVPGEDRQRQEPGTDAATAVSSAVATTAGGTSYVLLPGGTYVFLQVGAFRSAEGAKTAADALRGEGLAAAVEAGDPHLVFAAVATGRDEARSLGARLQTGNREIYLKEKTVPAARQIRWGAGTKEAAAFFEQGRKLSETVIRLTALRLGAGDVRKMDETTLQAVRSAHQAFDAAFETAAAGVPAEGKPAFDRMNRALDAAVLALENYNRTPSAALLWEAQNAVLDYLMAENELGSALAG